jgi:hypothetical protein
MGRWECGGEARRVSSLRAGCGGGGARVGMGEVPGWGWGAGCGGRKGGMHASGVGMGLFLCVLGRVSDVCCCC